MKTRVKGSRADCKQQRTGQLRRPSRARHPKKLSKGTSAQPASKANPVATRIMLDGQVVFPTERGSRRDRVGGHRRHGSGLGKAPLTQVARSRCTV